MNVGLAPFTLHEVDEPMPRKLDRVALAGYEGVELGVDDHTDEVLARLDDHDLAVSDVSVGTDVLEAGEFERVRAACDAFGCVDVRTGLGDERYESRPAAREAAETLERWADVAADHDLTLHCHNYDFEFTDVGGETAFEVVFANTDRLQFQLDVGWVGAGGEDPVDLLDRAGDRVSLLHVKDMDFAAGEFRTFGEGDLDVAGIVETARAQGVDWALVENDIPTDPVAELAHASLVLDQYTDHVCP
jgi:sugar phosphate isomerase/epimerase